MRLPLHLLWHCFSAAPPPVHVDVHLLPATRHVTPRAFVWLVGVETSDDPTMQTRLAETIDDLAHKPSRVVPWETWKTAAAVHDASTTTIVFTPLVELLDASIRSRTDVVRTSPLVQTPDGAWHSTPDADYVYVLTDQQNES